MRVRVVVRSDAQLFDMIETLSPPRRTAGGLDRRQQQRHENSDNGDHDQQLDEGKRWSQVYSSTMSNDAHCFPS